MRTSPDDGAKHGEGYDDPSCSPDYPAAPYLNIRVRPEERKSCYRLTKIQSAINVFELNATELVSIHLGEVER